MIPDLLKGLFGNFQAGAQLRSTTADIWRALRVGAANAFNGIRGIKEPFTDEQLEEQGRGILHQQGIGVLQVNAARHLAGQWLRARETLARMPEPSAIDAASIFTPSWHTTGIGRKPPRYRAHVLYGFTTPGGEQNQIWRTVELGSTLTTKGRLLQIARAFFPVEGDSNVPPGSTLDNIDDLTLETI